MIVVIWTNGPLAHRGVLPRGLLYGAPSTFRLLRGSYVEPQAPSELEGAPLVGEGGGGRGGYA